MKKYTLILAFALILGLTGCVGDKPSEGSINNAENSIPVSQSPTESPATVSNADPDEKPILDSVPVPQEKAALPEEGPDPIENSDMQSQSDEMQQKSDIQRESTPDRSTQDQSIGRPEAAGICESTEATVYPEISPEQPDPPAAEETAPEQQEEIPSQPSELEARPAPEPEPVPAEIPKSIYDYEFDVEAIRAELISLGESMGLTHITSDDGIVCTPDTCSWASPITASQSLQGENLKRALQSYVSSMPSIVTSYGGSAISYFTIYVQDNGGGSYTFYFLY